MGRRKIIGRHVLFWIVIFAFYLFSSTSSELFKLSLVTTLFKLPLLMIAAYFFNHWQIPMYFEKKRYFTFGISMILVIFLLVVLFRLMGYFYLDRFCTSGPYPLLSFVDFPLYMFTFHIPALTMYFFKSNREQEQERAKNLQLQKDKIETELKYLKSQLNPHFLFNTFNNLYAYVLNQSPKAPDMILQLSDILDYILYKSQSPRVPLFKEVEVIEHYIALEQIKYGDRLRVIFDKNGDYQHLEISPLILLSIIENAFKHGVRSQIEKPSIHIRLERIEDGIQFQVHNKKVTTLATDYHEKDNPNIGLSNILRQLELIYPKKYTLEIDESEANYNLNLILKIY